MNIFKAFGLSNNLIDTKKLVNTNINNLLKILSESQYTSVINLIFDLLLNFYPNSPESVNNLREEYLKMYAVYYNLKNNKTSQSIKINIFNQNHQFKLKNLAIKLFEKISENNKKKLLDFFVQYSKSVTIQNPIKNVGIRNFDNFVIAESLSVKIEYQNSLFINSTKS